MIRELLGNDNFTFGVEVEHTNDQRKQKRVIVYINREFGLGQGAILMRVKNHLSL